jgi:micrococcal nuclease
MRHLQETGEIQAKAQKAGVGIWSIENYAQEDGYHTEAVKKNVPEPIKSTTTTQAPAPKPKTQAAPQRPSQEVQQIMNDVFYANCTEDRAAGAAPIYRGEPGYRPKLDTR